MAVLPNTQRPRPPVVSDSRDSRKAHAGHARCLSPRPASDVFRILAVGAGAGTAATELDRRTGGPCWIRDAVFLPHRPRRAPDGGNLRRRLSPLRRTYRAHRPALVLAS